MTRFSDDVAHDVPRRSLALTVTAILAIAACGGGSSSPAATADSSPPAGPTTAPSGTAASPSTGIDPALVAAAEDEGGTLDIYSNTSEENWTPIFEAFKAAYPFITSISANDLGSDEVFERYLSESATGSSPADMLVTNAASAWATFAARGNVLTEYEPANLAGLPDFATVLPNVYAMSVDPLTIGYNSDLLQPAPTGLANLAEIVGAAPDQYNDKLTFRDVEGSFGFTVSYAFVQGNPDAWTALETLLPLSRPEESSGTQIEKITTGEYVAGFFISGAVAYPAQADSDGLFAVTYLDDGTVVLPRGIGITATAPHPNTARLFLEFVLSEAGQNAVAEGGLSSYRDGIPGGEGRHTYQELQQLVGDDSIIFVEYAEIPEAEINAFIERWNGLAAQ